MKKIISIGKFNGWDPTTTDSSTGKAYESINCDFGDKDYAFKPRKSGSKNIVDNATMGRIYSLFSYSPPSYSERLYAISANGLYELNTGSETTTYSGEDELFDIGFCIWGPGILVGTNVEMDPSYSGYENGRYDWQRIFLCPAKSYTIPTITVNTNNVNATSQSILYEFFKSENGFDWVSIEKDYQTVGVGASFIYAGTGLENVSPDCIYKIKVTLKSGVSITSISITESKLYKNESEIMYYGGASYHSGEGSIVGASYGESYYFITEQEMILSIAPRIITRLPGVGEGNSKLKAMGCPIPSSAPTAAASATAGSLSGTYNYKVAYVNTNGTYGNPCSGFGTVTVTSKKVDLSNIPTGGASDAITKRVIYRTKDGGNAYYKLTVIADNTTTSYVDNIPDTLLTELMETDNYAPPISSILHIHKNIMFFVDYADPTKLWFSKVSGYFSGSTAGGFEAVPLTYYKLFPAPIKGLKTLNGDLIVSGESFTSAVSGDIFGGPLDDTKVKSIADFGTVSHNGMALCIDKNMKNTLIVPTQDGLIAIYNGYENSIDVQPFGNEIRGVWSGLYAKDDKMVSIFKGGRLHIFPQNQNTDNLTENMCIVYDFNRESFVGIWSEPAPMLTATVHQNQIVMYQNVPGDSRFIRVWNYSVGYPLSTVNYPSEMQYSHISYSYAFDEPATIGFFDYDIEMNSQPYFVRGEDANSYRNALWVQGQRINLVMNEKSTNYGIAAMFQYNWKLDEVREFPRLWMGGTIPRISTGKIRYGKRSKNLLVYVSTYGGLFNMFRLNLYGFEGEE